MQTHCQTCKLPFHQWYHAFMPWLKTVKHFVNGPFCYGCAADYFDTLNPNLADVTAEIRACR